jgi:hypothetical protein
MRFNILFDPLTMITLWQSRRGQLKSRPTGRGGIGDRRNRNTLRDGQIWK